jgi:type IV pilus assembly protein PilQ
MKSDEALRKERNLKTEGAFEGKLIEPKAMLDQKKFIRESAKRIEETSELGPKITEIEDTNIREDASTLISKDEARNYVTLEDKGNIFPIDINVQNVDIRTFTQILAKLTGINFLVSDEVSGNVTAQLHDVPWPNVLDSVLNLKSLAKHVDNNANIIRIHSQEAIVKLETFERQRREDLQKALALEQATQPLYTEIFKLFYAKPDKMKILLSEVLGISSSGPAAGAISGTQSAQITVDARMNQLIIKARKEDMAIAKKLIAKLDSRTRQIFIEAFIVEASDQFSRALGSSLGVKSSEIFRNSGQNFYTGVAGVAGTNTAGIAAGTKDNLLTNLPAVGASSGVGLLGGIGDSATFKLELTAAANQSLSKIISNPRIFTLDNQQAVIFQGSDIPYTTTSSDGTKIEFKEAGLKLAVTPSVVGDGNLMMAIEVNKDTADTSITNPPITQSRITTNLVTKDGSVVVIGGIYTQTKTDGYDKVPGLGDIPLAGKLFRRDSNANNKKELMIFMSPKII